MTNSRFALHRHLFAIWLLGLSIPGCGSKPEERTDIVQVSPEELFGQGVKSTLFEFRAKVRKRGLNAAKQELPAVLETFENYEAQALGDQKDVYKQIFDKLTALKAEVEGAGNAATVKKTAEEIGELAAKLPGKAEENPEVE